MNRLSLVRAELLRRPARTVSGVLSLAIGLSLFLSLQAYSTGYRGAARAPLAQIGADVVAQRQGDRPESFEGIVFPHSTAPITPVEVDRIAAVAGVEAVGRAMFFWSFQDRDLLIGLGVDASSDVGPARLRAGVQAGRFLQPGESGTAVLDASYAQQKSLAVGSTVTIAGQALRVVGVADTTRAGQVANANVYLPLADAQRMVATAPAVRQIHDIGSADVNVVFLRTNPARTATITRDVSAVLGRDALVTTPQTFSAALGSTFTLIDRFAVLIGLCALLVAAAGLLRSVAANLAQRQRDVAVMRAVGWPRRAVTTELLMETSVVVFLGLIVGITLAWALTLLMSRFNVVIPVPWELNPSPHFLPGGAKALSVTVPLPASIRAQPLLTAIGASVAAAGLAVTFAARRAARIKPTEVWREA